MMVLWAACGPPFGAYAVVQRFNVPVQVQPQVFTLLAVVAWAQTLVYGRGWAGWRAGVAGVGLAAFLGGVEGLLVVLVEVGAPGGGFCCDAGS